MRRLDHIHIHVMVGNDRAAHRGHTNGVSKVSALLQHLHNQAMGNAMGAAGAIMQLGFPHSFGIFKYGLHLTSPP